jgi:hypothetical protein
MFPFDALEKLGVLALGAVARARSALEELELSVVLCRHSRRFCHRWK